MNRSLRKSLSSNLFLAIGVSATENGWPKGLACLCHCQFPAQNPICGIWKDVRSIHATVIMPSPQPGGSSLLLITRSQEESSPAGSILDGSLRVGQNTVKARPGAQEPLPSYEGTDLMTNNVPGKERFQEAYQGKPPWDIGRPQKVFVEAADQITGSTIDVGCGTAENALFFASRGRKVTGIDFLERPITEAKQKATDRGLEATFLVMDALHLADIPELFDSAIDCGLFHVFSDEDRARYVSGLASVVRPGGRLFLLCFSEKEPPGDGPRRISQEEIHEAFADGWVVESIQEARFEVRPDLEDIHFSEGGPYAWFCVIRRNP